MIGGQWTRWGDFRQNEQNGECGARKRCTLGVRTLDCALTLLRAASSHSSPNGLRDKSVVGEGFEIADVDWRMERLQK